MLLKSIIDTHFTEDQLRIIMVMLLLMLISVVLFLRNKPGLSVLFLFLTGLVARLFAASLDPYLNGWDEQFHALVAKNMMAHPFKPMLNANPIFPYEYQNWTANHIWLHKQPWFLWQIAIFLKLFGLSEFVLRLPMAITLSIITPVIYRIGALLTNEKVAWYGAFLYATSNCFVVLCIGAPLTEHNDAAFLFYVTMSLWSWIEYKKSGKQKWILWIGIFSGIAILNKWLPGLLVYSGWLVSIMTTSRGKQILRELKPLVLALGITIVFALPWQIYILYRFPLESRCEYKYNSEHFFTALEGHHGDSWYYFERLTEQYGSVYILLIIIPAIFIFVKMIQDKGARNAILTYIITTFLFFTIAATKMPLFTTIVSSLLFLSLGGLTYWLLNELNIKKLPRLNFLIMVPVLCILGYINLNLTSIDKFHTDQRYAWRCARNITIINKMASKWLPSSEYVVFNSGGWNAIAFMYYNPNIAYGFYPAEYVYQELKQRKIKIATFADGNIPDYLRRDPEVIKIPLHFPQYPL